MATESLSSYRVLPPIVFFEKDRNFLAELSDFVESGLQALSEAEGAEEQFLVYRAAFDKVIQYVTSYQPLLTAIKGEYERLISSVRQGHQNAAYLRSQIEVLAAQPTTVANYRRRCAELESEIERQNEHNAKLEQRAESLRTAIEAKRKEHEDAEKPPPKVVRRDRRLLPGFSIDEMTDAATLSRTLADLDAQLRDLDLSRRTKFAPKSHYQRLWETLQEKLERRDTAAEAVGRQEERSLRMRAAVEAARSFHKVLPPHQSVADAVIRAVRLRKKHAPKEERHEAPKKTRTFKIFGSSLDEDEASPDQDSELIFEYLEKFNELVEENRLDDAVLHAANSPRGILCSLDILIRFEQLEAERNRPGLLLEFCCAFLAVAPAAKLQPSAEVSFKCLQCALDNDRLDLVPHWVPRLTFSTALAELLATSASAALTERNRTLFFDLAAFVFVQLGSVGRALDCYIAAGRVDTALELAQHHGALDTRAMLELLSRHPQRSLALCLLQRSLAPLPDICRTLQATGQLKQVGAVVDEVIEEEVRRCPGKPTAAIAERIMMLSGISMDDWRAIIRATPSLVHLYDMLATTMVSDILTASLDILTDLEKEGEN